MRLGAVLASFLPAAALAAASAVDLLSRLSLERAAAARDGAAAEAARPLLPFDAYARQAPAGLLAAREPDRARALVEEGLSRRPKGPDLLRLAAQLEALSGREARAGDLLVEAVVAARDSTGFAVEAAEDRLAAARRHAAAASLARERAQRLLGAGSAKDAARESSLAAEEAALAREALLAVPRLRRALAPEAVGWTEMDRRVTEAERLLADLLGTGEGGK